MLYFILLDTVYISTLLLWYSLEYLLNLFVSEVLNWLSKMSTKMIYFYVIFIYLTLYLILNYATT